MLNDVIFLCSLLGLSILALGLVLYLQTHLEH